MRRNSGSSRGGRPTSWARQRLLRHFAGVGMPHADIIFGRFSALYYANPGATSESLALTDLYLNTHADDDRYNEDRCPPTGPPTGPHPNRRNWRVTRVLFWRLAQLQLCLNARRVTGPDRVGYEVLTALGVFIDQHVPLLCLLRDGREFVDIDVVYRLNLDPDSITPFCEDALPTPVIGFHETWIPDNSRKASKFVRIISRLFSPRTGKAYKYNSLAGVRENGPGVIRSVCVAVYKCSKLGLYRDAGVVPTLEERLASQLRVMQGATPDPQDTEARWMAEITDVDFIVAAKEFIVYVIEASAILSKLADEVMDWAAYRNSVRRVADAHRGCMSQGGLTTDEMFVVAKGAGYKPLNDIVTNLHSSLHTKLARKTKALQKQARQLELAPSKVTPPGPGIAIPRDVITHQVATYLSGRVLDLGHLRAAGLSSRVCRQLQCLSTEFGHRRTHTCAQRFLSVIDTHDTWFLYYYMTDLIKAASIVVFPLSGNVARAQTRALALKFPGAEGVPGWARGMYVCTACRWLCTRTAGVTRKKSRDRFVCVDMFSGDATCSCTISSAHETSGGHAPSTLELVDAVGRVIQDTRGCHSLCCKCAAPTIVSPKYTIGVLFYCPSCYVQLSQYTHCDTTTCYMGERLRAWSDPKPIYVRCEDGYTLTRKWMCKTHYRAPWSRRIVSPDELP